MKLSAIIILLFSPIASYAADYEVDYGQSSVSFSGEHAGNVFTGKFDIWEAQIKFDPEDLENSLFLAKFDIGSAKTGDATYDGTMPQADWFNIKDYNSAVFESKSIAEREGGGYMATGNLIIRALSQPASFGFTFSDLSVAPVKASGEFIIDRLAYDIGKKSDPNAEWVSREIRVMIDIVASQNLENKN